jgi:hypothetical protein
MGGACRAYGGQERRIQGFGGETWRTETTLEDNIKMDLQEVGCGGMDWIKLVQDSNRWRAPVKAVMNLRVTSNAGNFLTSWELLSFSRRTVLHGVSK